MLGLLGSNRLKGLRQKKPGLPPSAFFFDRILQNSPEPNQIELPWSYRTLLLPESFQSLFDWVLEGRQIGQDGAECGKALGGGDVSGEDLTPDLAAWDCA